MKIKKQHRLLSLVFSLALVISALGAGVPTSAENGADNVITGANVYLWPNMSVSDLKNLVKAESNDLKGSFVETTVWKNGALTDVVSNYGSNMETGWFNFALNDDYTFQRKSGSSVDDVSNDVDQTDNYWSLRFKINGTLNNPKSFVLNFHKSVKTLVSQHYAVFAADSIDKLESSKIIEMKSSAERCGDFFDVSGLNLTNINYVEVRIYHRGFNQQNWGSKPIIMGQHINEIGFFGGTVNSNEGTAITEHTSFANKTDAQNAVTAAGTNHLSGQNYEASTFHNGGNLEQTETIKADDIANSTFFNSIIDDSSIGAWHKHSCESSSASNDIFQTSDYREMVIGLSEAVNNPEKFVFSFHPDGGLPSRHYSVYMSDKRDTLFDDVSKVIEITDSKARVGDLIDLTGLNIKNVLYVGIRIYSFGMAYANGCKIQHISEIGLYGGKIAGDVNGDGTVDTADLSSLRKYLLGIEVNENYVYDVNGDGKTDICDLVKLKKIFADIGN